jgi:hypothetical protein
MSQEPTAGMVVAAYVRRKRRQEAAGPAIVPAGAAH